MRLTETLGALRERNFRLLFLGQSISLLGTGMVPVALSFAVLDVSGSVADLGFVQAARTVPMVLFFLIGGVFADRLPRRAVMVTSDLVHCAAQGLLAALLITGGARIWQIAALQAVHGAATAFFLPAVTGLVPQTVSREHLQQANALRGLADAGGGVVGPAIAGALVAGVGSGWAIAADAASSALSAVFLLQLRLPPRPRAAAQTVLRDLADGWNDFRSRTWLWASVIHASLANAFVLAPFLVLGAVVSSARWEGPAPGP